MIISEVGLNHMGDIKLLNKYIKAIHKTDIDAVTVQVLRKEFYDNADYAKYKIEDNDLIRFLSEVKGAGKKIGVAIDDINKIKKYESIGMDIYKVLSKDLHNTGLIYELVKTNAESIYLSTGMSTYEEIDKVINELMPLDKRIKLIHTQLSHGINDVNLKAISVMKERYSLPVAYGHHCVNPAVVYVSIGYEPESTFFYIKGQDNLKYPDDQHAISVNDVSIFGENIVSLQQTIGSGIKEKMKDWAS